jgi:HK97 family phage portal protein
MKTLPNGVKAYNLETMLRRLAEHNSNRMTAYAAYQQVPFMRLALTRVAQGVSGIPFALHKDGERIATEQDYKSMELPFSVNMRAFVNELAGDLQLYGRAHFIQQQNRVGMQRVERLGGAYITYYTSSSEYVTRIDYRRGGYLYSADAWQTLDEGGMPYIWLPNRQYDNLPGDPPALTAIKAAGMLDQMVEYGKYFFEHGGAGPTLIQVEDFDMLATAEQERVRSWFERFTQGVKNAFRPLVLRNGVQVHQMGSSVKDIEMPDLSREKREEILAAFGIPASLGLSNAANYSTALVDKLNFYEYTLMPLWNLIGEGLNERFFGLYGYEIRMEPHRLDVFQQNELSRSSFYLPYLDRGVIGVNEVRSYLSMPPRDEITDDYFLSSPGDDLPATAGSVTIEKDKGVSNESSDMPEPETEGDESDREVKGMESPAYDDLAKWERMALKRFKEGSPEKALGFESDVIPFSLAHAIRGALAVCTTEQDVRTVFSGLTVWEGYG